MRRRDTKDLFVWTELVNCGEIGVPFLESFLAHHDVTIHVFGLLSDLHHLPNNPQVIKIPLDSDHESDFISKDVKSLIIDRFKLGHSGTAALWSAIISNRQERYLIHLDSDTVFLGNIVSLLEQKLREGFAVVGPRRLYASHDGELTRWQKVLYKFYSDAIHTYAFGFDRTMIYSRGEQLTSMISGQGRNRFVSRVFPVIDFFDRITFMLAKEGDSFFYCAPSDTSNNSVNDPTDLEEALISFFAVGSGCAFYFGRATSESKTYAKIAIQSFALFSMYLLDFRVEATPLSLPKIEAKLKALDRKTWTLIKIPKYQ